ncbi:MAG: MBL fold metallo-hydrolase [Candidatus Aenigmarchaeota archaeon]|nr:MBL fold metallo-hydrolase [Candidatus Aenigmarchaeota archaeon]MDI6722419.1 MBL fold metallo-hydrolase [Candidatus Aenigmarchaeota archaeon]
MPVKITLLGTGEAFDPDRYNTAYLIEGQDFSIHVDAGYSVFDSLCKVLGGTKELLEKPDMIMVTHGHGDHTGSIARELMTMWEERAYKPNRRDIILAGGGANGNIPDRINMDYPGFWDRFEFEGPRVSFEYIYPHTGMKYNGLAISTASTKHSIPNNAYRFEGDGFSFAISGDGAMTPESRKLYEGVDLLFHEGFFADKSSDVHSSVDEVYYYAKSAGIKQVGIVHVGRYERLQKEKLREYISRSLDSGFLMFFPKDHQIIEV